MSSCPASCCSDFTADYALLEAPVFRDLERAVLGCSYGGTSWTTREQADAIPGLLGLGPDAHLLEIGSGAGWPGVYVARRSGCRISMLDLPLNALQRAVRNARDELDGAAEVIQASGAALPFRDDSFDFIAHSDVLCCLPEKREMLSECRRVLRPGGRMLFYVIAPAPGLERADLAEALEAGPPFAELDGDYPAMLRNSGWRCEQRSDVTAEYQATLERMVEGMKSRASELADCMGEQEFAEGLARRKQQVAAVARGLLVREVYLAEAA